MQPAKAESISPHIAKNSLYIETDYFLDLIKSWGATLAGVGDVREGLAREFRHMPTAVSLAVAHPPSEEGIVRRGGIVAYSNQYPRIDAFLEGIQAKIVAHLRFLGFRAFAIPPDTDKKDPRFVARLFPLFPHKTAATCAGLGWVGKNGLLVNRAYGARLSWGTVLTNAPLKTSDRPYLKGRCDSCNRCVEACPANAISPEEWVRGRAAEPKINVEACAGRLRENFKVLGAYICGICVLACPLGSINHH